MENKSKKLLIVLCLVIFLSVSLVSSFELEKHLVQYEVDENFPCHIENENEIVCAEIDNHQIDEFKDKVSLEAEIEEVREGDVGVIIGLGSAIISAITSSAC